MGIRQDLEGFPTTRNSFPCISILVMQHEHREMLIESRGSPPHPDWFKFNVYGEGRGKPSLVGIGVLRNISE